MHIILKSVPLQLRQAVCMLCVFLAFKSQNAAAQSFEIEGSITQLLHPTGRTVTNSVKLFKVYVREEQWRIETVSVMPKKGGKTIVGFDGRDQYHLVLLEGKQEGALGTNRPINSATATIHQDPVPFPGDNCVGVVWLAAASHTHLKSSLKVKMLRPQWILPVSNSRVIDYRVPVQYEQYSEIPHLTRSVTFHNSGQRFSKVGSAISLVNEEARFATGYTNGFFEVSHFTNVHNLFLPAQFSLTQYRPIRSQPGIRFEAATSYLAECLNFKHGCDLPSLIPDPVPITATTDFRTRFIKTNLAFIHYNVTNRWRQLTEKQIQERISIDSKARPQQVNPGIGLARAILIVCVSISSCVLIWVVVNNKNKETRK